LLFLSLKLFSLARFLIFGSIKLPKNSETI
jgi:hypothetical protein